MLADYHIQSKIIIIIISMCVCVLITVASWRLSYTLLVPRVHPERGMYAGCGPQKP